MTSLRDLSKEIAQEQGVDTKRFALSEAILTRYINVWRDKIGLNLVARVEGNPENVKYEVENNRLVISLRNGGHKLTDQDLEAFEMLGRRLEWVEYQVLIKSLTEIPGAKNSKSESERIGSALKALVRQQEVKASIVTESSAFAKVAITMQMPHTTQKEKNTTYNIMGTIISAALTQDITYF